jgi:toxin ParE1/3/4
VRIRRLPRAIRDLDALWDWIAAEDLKAADRLLERIVKATNRLAEARALSSARARAALSSGNI